MAKEVDVDAAVDVINRQVADIAEAQARGEGKPKKGDKLARSRLTSEVMTMTRAVSAWQAERRKTGDEAEREIDSFTPERTAALALRLIQRLSPEHRAACRELIDQMDGKLIAHGGT